MGCIGMLQCYERALRQTRQLLQCVPYLNDWFSGRNASSVVEVRSTPYLLQHVGSQASEPLAREKGSPRWICEKAERCLGDNRRVKSPGGSTILRKPSLSMAGFCGPVEYLWPGPDSGRIVIAFGSLFFVPFCGLIGRHPIVVAAAVDRSNRVTQEEKHV